MSSPPSSGSERSLASLVSAAAHSVKLNRAYLLAPAVAAGLLAAVLLSSLLDFSAFSASPRPAFPPPTAGAPANASALSAPPRAPVRTALDTLGTRPREPFTALRDAYARWDAAVGCAAFAEKHRSRSSPPPGPAALQDPEAAPCGSLRLPHVALAVRGVTWVPDILDGVYQCRCGLTCLWSRNEEALADTPDVVLYEIWPPPDTRKQGEPLRAFMDIEPTRKRSGHEDIFIGYHADDDVQVTYAGKFFRITHNYHVATHKRDDVLVYWSSSRCFEHRNKIARELFRHLPAHSFGRCENNVGGGDKALELYPDCARDGHGAAEWWDHLHCAMSHYKFVLAIENTIADSYATEKLYYALEAGSVPIYFGAPNARDLAPPGSYIDGAAFASAEELAAYVREVAGDPAAYAEFHAWRRCGVLGGYGRNRLVSLDTLPCRLCERASRMGGRHAPAPNATVS
ncbi:alpha-(1,4)-fucosyltransferase-like [Oryza glaberrima]|uniref:Fucosyltransferase n=2 Tax=Oryza TaxID=4527 RepID=A0A0E0P9C2_ORYRU|nr:alpha-(1,4)-fucosyltransferase-like [Oryza glaberrima]